MVWDKMKISDVFKRKKKGQEEIDQIIQENINAEEDAPQELPVEKEGAGALKKIKIDLEKAVAEVKVLRELSKVSEERFQRISEEIGEIRRAGMERERKIDKTKIEAKKAAGLVQEVQPQNLMKEVMKVDAKFQSLEAREKANKELIERLTAEIGEIRSTLSTFRGMEALIELNEEMKREIKTMKSIQLLTEKHADKVENIFMRTQTAFNSFSKLSQEFRALEKRFEELMKESEKVKRESQELAKKEDVNKLQVEMEKKLEGIDKTKRGLEKRRKEMTELSAQMKSSSSEVERLEKRLKQRLTEVNDELSKLSRMEEKDYVTEEKFNQELDDFFNNILKKLELLEAKIKD